LLLQKCRQSTPLKKNFSINEKSTEDALRSIQKPADLQEIIADKLEKSPFAFIIELTSSNLAQKSQPFLDKIIRAALMVILGSAN
jgi:hypothetical protein